MSEKNDPFALTPEQVEASRLRGLRLTCERLLELADWHKAQGQRWERDGVSEAVGFHAQQEIWVRNEVGRLRAKMTQHQGRVGV